MSIVVVQAGDLVVLDPSDIRVIAFDWDVRNFASTVQASTSTFTITAIRQTGVTALTKDNESKLTAAQATTAFGRTVTGDNRGTQLRLNATTATLNDLYEVANKVVTNESPSQTKEQSIQVLIQQR
jgi:hypothetical protein